jgi:hypothetical protein
MMAKRVETACAGRGSVLAGMMALLIATCGVVARGGDLASGFQTPSADCRPDVWWRFFGDEITEEGALQDVRELAAAGACHAQMFHLAGTPEGTVAFLSPQWWKVMESAGKEAARQGMHISPQHMSGWSSGGGPWITPDRSMQKLVWTTKSVSGQGAVTLLQPETVLKYYRDVAVLAYPVEEAIGADMAVRPTVTLVSGKAEGDLPLLVDGRPETQVKLTPEAGKTDIILELTYERPITVRSLWIDPVIEGSYMAGTLHGYGGEIQAETTPGQFKTIGSIASACTVLPATSAAHFRIRVQAPPVLINNRINEIDLSPVSRLHQFEIKSAMVAKMAMQAQPPTADSSVVVDPAKIVDLTGKMSADGKLAWDVPPGRWVVLRIGQTSSDRMGRVSTKDGLGLESDKLDADATRLHFDSYSGKFITRINQESPGVVNEVFMDSWESGSQNWTAKMPEEFLRRRGYDLKPYLPALTGLIVGNVEQTERFLWDLRRTVADLIADNFYGVMREKSNSLGAQLVAEASGPFHGLNPVVDALQAKGRTDIPMGEFLHPAAMRCSSTITTGGL